MSGKYGCPWTHMACSQGCGCCKDCKNKCHFICGVYLHNEGEPELKQEPSQELHTV